MNFRQLQTIFAIVLLVAAATSSTETLHGELSLSATAHELLGDDATALFGSAIDPNEVAEWELYVPRDYDPGLPAGLLVFISPTDSGRMPRRYQPVLDERNLIWIGANHSGNRVRVARRVSLALLATALADRHYRIDASRVYVSGFSGGGRAASAMAPEYAQIFTGAIYICGVNFWNGRKPKRLDRVRHNRYVFLTGDRDFNRAETRKVHRAYRRAGVTNVLLLEVAGMDHRMPPVEDLATAIDFLE
ncbi:MAG TPA: PHB depolymerase family esterase [Afifellaceae bacterium]|nr:PHB depolymerase family esterase [Afifellaceae bacterium]